MHAGAARGQVHNFFFLKLRNFSIEQELSAHIFLTAQEKCLYQTKVIHEGISNEIHFQGIQKNYHVLHNRSVNYLPFSLSTQKNIFFQFSVINEKFFFEHYVKKNYLQRTSRSDIDTQFESTLKTILNDHLAFVLSLSYSMLRWPGFVFCEYIMSIGLAN